MSTAARPSALPSDYNFQAVIPAWRVNHAPPEIVREFIFANFERAFEFMTLCAQYANEIDHHPEWSNVWNKVNVHLSTHSAKALTELDIRMAQAMDRFAQQVMQAS